jgi:hypothetical protein
MSTSRRRQLSDVISPAALDTPAMPQHPPQPAAPAPERSPAPAAAADAPPVRPTARELAAPPRGPVAREALKADVPADLGLLQRLRRYRLDKGMDIRDQVAIAVDEWLTSQGY